MKEKGQIILILILVMTVALAIGLSIVQKSLVDVSTSSKVEQSSRAFSAAEAGIEKALQAGSTNCTGASCPAFTNNNSSVTSITGTGLVPCVPGSSGCAQGNNTQQVALEFPSVAKEDVTQIWLSDYTSLSTTNPPTPKYKGSTLEVYWGTYQNTTDKAAIELTLVYWDGSSYQPRKWYLDWSSSGRTNGFDNTVSCSGGISESDGTTQYQCHKTLSSLPTGLVLLRARLLYNSIPQPLAIRADGTCGVDCSLPAQQQSITSTGVSGETQRTVSVTQTFNVVAPFFDYAIFSAGDITK